MSNQVTRYSLVHYLGGALPARFGDEMAAQTILLLGLAGAHTATIGSSLLAALTFSAALGGPLLGAALDRACQPGRLLALTLGLYAMGLAVLAATLAHIPFFLSIMVAGVSGFLMAAISGGWSSQLKLFIAKEKLPRASAVDAATFNIAGLAGPAAAGLIALTFSPLVAMAVLIMLLLAALPMAWLLPRRHAQTNAHHRSFFVDVMAGFKTIATRPKLFRITLLSAISYLGIGMLWVICPLAGLSLTGEAGYGGFMMSVLAVGALAATAVYAKWPTRFSPDAVAVATTFILSLSMLLLALTGSLPMALIAMFIAGLADGPQLAAVFTIRHRESPERARSQVFTTGASSKITAAAGGAALAGQLSKVSLLLAILTAATVQLLAAGSFVVVGKRIR